MRRAIIVYLGMLALQSACSDTPPKDGAPLIAQEQKKISSLLQDTVFALKAAQAQEAAYYTSSGQPVPPFLTAADSTALIRKSYKDEKTAINLAGFYALECGAGALVMLKGETPLHWMRELVNGTLDDNSVLLLNRFANATWKAGQPFRGMDRIGRANFMVADQLSEAEIKKDQDQLMAAALKLLTDMEAETSKPRERQWERIEELLQDSTYAAGMARHMEAAYYTGQHQPVPPFLEEGQDTAMISKSKKEDKIATNLAGIYAVECGVNYLARVRQKAPSHFLKEIVEDKMDKKDKELLERFANATWKASQPFRSMERIRRSNFIPFDLLPAEEVEKDWVQVQAAAQSILDELMKQ